jgi:hypothetical protein
MMLASLPNIPSAAMAFVYPLLEELAVLAAMAL